MWTYLPAILKTADREVHFVLCNNLDTLIWLANLASLELHVTLSTAGAYDSPDLLLFDIDPEPPLSFDDTIDVAHIVHERLEKAGMQSYVKTSGKKGLHIVVPLSSRLPLRRDQGICPYYGKNNCPGHSPCGRRVSPFTGPRDNLHRLPPERPRENHGSPVQPQGNRWRNGICTPQLGSS